MARSRSAAWTNTSSGPLAATAASAPKARRFVRKTLRGVARSDADLVEVAVLLVSELVTNAVLHAVTKSHVEVAVSDETVRVEVHDGSTTMPRRRRPAALEPGGRGMLLVDRLSSRWGSDPTPAGKFVWYELDRAAIAS